MKQRVPVFSSLPLLLSAVLAVLCVGCVIVIPISMGGHVSVPEHGSVAILDSAAILESSGIVWLGDAVLDVSAGEYDTWEGADEGVLTKYNRKLQSVGSSTFPLQDDKRTVEFVVLGEYALLLNEYDDGDSMGVIARQFDVSAKLHGKAVRIAQSIIEDDDEEKPRSRYAVEFSPDSSVFCVWNTAYKEDNAGTTLQIDVCNKQLEVLQHRVIAVADSAKVGNINVDNTGAIAIVRMDTSGRMVCQRYVAGRDAEEMELTIPSARSVKRRLESADVVCSNEGEWTVFSFIRPDTSKSISSMVLHSCDWATGKTRVLTEYEITERNVQKIAGDKAMKDFRIHGVLVTNRGFVVWSEAIANRMQRIYGTKTVTDVWYTYAGPVGFFAFDKQGEFLWQRSISRNNLWYRGDQIYSAPTLYNDTLRVLYESNASAEATATGTAQAVLSMKSIALATGEISLETPVLSYNGYAYWRRNDMQWIDPQTLLLRCYEGDADGARMFTMRVKGR